MNETTQKLYEDALTAFVEARTNLAEATVAYDRDRHATRTALYALKESGTRKMTEEQIRSEAVVKCQDVYEKHTRALSDCEIARERLEFAKTVITNA